MAEEKKIARLVDVGELEADLKKDLAEEEAKGKAADILFCESIEDELSDLEKLPTIDPKTLPRRLRPGQVPQPVRRCGRDCTGRRCPGSRPGRTTLAQDRRRAAD